MKPTIQLNWRAVADHSGCAEYGMNRLSPLEHWNRGFESFSRHESMCVRLFCVCVVLCIGSGLATGLSPVQGAVPTVYRLINCKSGQGPQGLQSHREIDRSARASKRNWFPPNRNTTYLRVSCNSPTVFFAVNEPSSDIPLLTPTVSQERWWPTNQQPYITTRQKSLAVFCSVMLQTYIFVLHPHSDFIETTLIEKLLIWSY
jgi:hypothetical protein